MPSPDKLFRLDPVETKITAPVSQFQGLADAADRSVANRSLGRGLTAFSQALGSLAQFKKEDQVREDIKTAKDAAVRGEVMPDVLPVAEKAFQNIVDVNTSADSLLSIDRFENGAEFNSLVENPEIPSSEKTKEMEASYDDFYARAVQTIQSPEVRTDLRNKINLLKEKSYQKVYEAEKTQRTLEGINGISNIIKDAVVFSENKQVPLTETFTGKWIDNVSKDLGVSHPFIPENERKLLAFQALTANPDVIADPEIASNLLNEKFNKNITYHNLYFGKGDDAEEFRKIYDKFLTNTVAYSKKLADTEAAADLERIAVAKDLAKETFLANPNMNIEDLGPALAASGLDLGKVGTYLKGLITYRDLVTKEQLGSSNHNEVRDLALDGTIKDKRSVDDYGIIGNLSPDSIAKIKELVGEENTQRADNTKTYLKSTATIKSTLVGLIKNNLKSKNKDITAILANPNPSMADLSKLVVGTTIDPDTLRIAFNEINDLVVKMEGLAEFNAFKDAAAEGAGGVSPQNIKAFQAEMQKQVEALADKVNRDLSENQFSHLDADPKSSLNMPTAGADSIGEFGVITTPSGDPSKTVRTDTLGSTKEVFDFRTNEAQIQEKDIKNKVIIKDATQGKTGGLTEWLTSFFSTSDKGTPEIILKELIVDAPRSPSEQKFLDTLKAGKNPSKEYKETIKDLTREELLETNLDAKARLERQDEAQQKPQASDKTLTDASDKGRGFFPDVPNERSDLRKLQDTAQFQDDRTILDVISFADLQNKAADLFGDVMDSVFGDGEKKEFPIDIDVSPLPNFDTTLEGESAKLAIDRPDLSEELKTMVPKLIASDNVFENLQLLEKHPYDQPFKPAANENFDTGPYGIRRETANKILGTKFKTDDKMNLQQIKQVVDTFKADVDKGLDVLEAQSPTPFPPELRRAVFLSLYNVGRAFKDGKFIKAPNASKALAEGDFKKALTELFSKEKGITKSKGKYNPGIYKRSIAILGLAEYGINK